MNFSKLVDILIREELPNPDFGCMACERSGLPILLLRTADTLQRGALRATEGVMISAEAARTLASDGMRSLRGAATNTNSAGLMMALGILWFHQDGLRRNYEALQQGAQDNPEALAAIWSSSIGLIGASVETTGFAIKLLQPKLKWPGVGVTVSLGESLVRFGAAVAATAGFMDAVLFRFAAMRTEKQGDTISKRLYNVGVGLSTLSAIAAIFAAATGFALAPIVIAVTLSLAAYGLASTAKKTESSLTELWARRTKWGLPTEHRRWLNPSDLDSAIGELNAASLGVSAEASINIQFMQDSSTHSPGALGIALGDHTAVPAAFMLVLNITAPHFTREDSRYEWQLTLYQGGSYGGPIVIDGSSDSPEQLTLTATRISDTFSTSPAEITPRINVHPESKTLNIQVALPLTHDHTINAIDLSFTYWPDSHDQSGYAKITNKHDEINNMRRVVL
ncbi:hypothetical protein [Pseudomonas sp. PSKL.D1]|uniref:hypothetical protein n=1 Tax=Pseudomonas sp. PSKL.D1 TaxID=3029060 RepID=UPI002380EBC3|nr:hypothetical protein [Pseudomonas sp. PSKL.D1]WDY55738.1 hypothetical protein PVV54_14060 [Pseudomonas sp. PSKL.D1]